MFRYLPEDESNMIFLRGNPGIGRARGLHFYFPQFGELLTDKGLKSRIELIDFPRPDCKIFVDEAMKDPESALEMIDQLKRSYPEICFKLAEELEKDYPDIALQAIEKINFNDKDYIDSRIMKANIILCGKNRSPDDKKNLCDAFVALENAGDSRDDVLRLRSMITERLMGGSGFEQKLCCYLEKPGKTILMLAEKISILEDKLPKTKKLERRATF